MARLRTVVIAGAAIALIATAAVAASVRYHTMQVGLPDGSTAQITYAGDIAPKVAIAPAAAPQAADLDPVAAMERDMAAVQQRHAEVMRQIQAQVAAAQQQAGAGQQQVVVTGNAPAGGSYSYATVSSSTGKGTCTQTVQWSSDGSGKAPQVVRASSGDCGAVKQGEGDKPVPAAAPRKAPAVDPRSI